MRVLSHFNRNMLIHPARGLQVTVLSLAGGKLADDGRAIDGVDRASSYPSASRNPSNPSNISPLWILWRSVVPTAAAAALLLACCLLACLLLLLRAAAAAAAAACLLAAAAAATAAAAAAACLPPLPRPGRRPRRRRAPARGWSPALRLRPTGGAGGACSGKRVCRRPGLRAAAGAGAARCECACVCVCVCVCV